MTRRIEIGSFFLVVVIILAILFGWPGWIRNWLWGNNGATIAATTTPVSKDVKLVRAYIVDPDDPDPRNRVRESIDLEAIEADDEVVRVYDSGASALALGLEEDDRPFEGEVIISYPAFGPDGAIVTTSQKVMAENGRVGFLIELIAGTKLTGDPNLSKPFKVSISTDTGLVGDLLLHIVDLLGPGSIVADTIEDEDELTIELEIDPLLIKAVERFCGFSVSEIDHPALRINDKSRFQVALVNGELIEARSVIPVGQPVWVIISKGGTECFINPPCGNPEVPEGKLPPAPLELQSVPTLTPLPPTVTRVIELPTPIFVVRTPTQTPVLLIPTVTVTPVPTFTPTNTALPTHTLTPTQTGTIIRTPTKTPTFTPTLTRVPSNTPTKTPTVPVPTPTRTSVPSPPLVTFSGFVQHGENLCEWRGVFTASQNVTWFVNGGQVVSQDARNLTVDVQSSVGGSSSVTVTASNGNGSNSRTEVTPLCSPAVNTPGPSRTPLPTWTPDPNATTSPSPVTTPVPP